MGRDLLVRPYGRFYHLPRLLASKGHNVTILLCSYRMEPEVNAISSEDGIVWHSVSPLKGNPFRYFSKALQLVREIRPDWIGGFSDTYYGILAQYVASRNGCRSLIDAYDNYESYIHWCKPLHYLWRRALGHADLVTAAGPQLADYLQRSRSRSKVVVVPMAADPMFSPQDRVAARKRLQLPLQKKLIGYCGSICRSRGIDFLFELANHFANNFPDVEFFVSGRKQKGLVIPSQLRWLGFIPAEQMPDLLNSMDLLLVINEKSSFGNFSYPVKLYEAMQCEIPVVATETAPISWIINRDERFLGDPFDLDGFVVKVNRCLGLGRQKYPALTSWEKNASDLESILIGKSDNYTENS